MLCYRSPPWSRAKIFVFVYHHIAENHNITLHSIENWGNIASSPPTIFSWHCQMIAICIIFYSGQVFLFWFWFWKSSLQNSVRELSVSRQLINQNWSFHLHEPDSTNPTARPWQPTRQHEPYSTNRQHEPDNTKPTTLTARTRQHLQSTNHSTNQSTNRQHEPDSTNPTGKEAFLRSPQPYGVALNVLSLRIHRGPVTCGFGRAVRYSYTPPPAFLAVLACGFERYSYPPWLPPYGTVRQRYRDPIWIRSRRVR